MAVERRFVVTVGVGGKPMREGYRLWLRESNSHVWHGVRTRLGGYRTGCGLEFDALVGKDIWPLHDRDIGPAEFDRCQWCQAAVSISRR